MLSLPLAAELPSLPVSLCPKLVNIWNIEKKCSFSEDSMWNLFETNGLFLSEINDPL